MSSVSGRNNPADAASNEGRPFHRERSSGGIVKVRLDAESPLTATLVANAITLTPGTMTLTARLDPAELTVHVLGLGDTDEFRASVEDLERRVVAALTPQLRSTAAGLPPPAADLGRDPT